jgi:Rrf2 family protein
MYNSRFAISLHILTLLAHEDGEWLSSEYIAGSININPVLVRKELSNLRQHGLVQSREGKNGGSCLARPANKILLSEIFEAIRSESALGTTKNDPNPACKIGRQINKHLDNLYQEVDDLLVQKLSKTTVAAFYREFKV